MRVRLTPPFRRTLLAYVVLCLVFFLYGYWNFYGDPGSIFFDERRAYQAEYSQYRIEQAKTLMTVFDATPFASLKAGAFPQFCATFITEKRSGEQYIKTAVSTALFGLTNEERENLRVNVQFSHTDPSVHPDWDDPWLKAAVDSVYSYDVTPELLAHLKVLEEEEQGEETVHEKAVVDYTEAMQRCYDSGADWIIIFEDDVVLADGWFAQLYDAVLKIEDMHRNELREWVYLRLFDIERSLAWEPFGQQNEALLILAIVGSVAAVLISFRCLSDRAKRLCDNLTLGFVCLVVIPTFVLLYFKAGKSSMHRPSTGLHEQHYGCCAQGLVYPKKMIPRLRGYLRDKEEGWLDLLVNDFADKDRMDFARYALYPVQMQHIGSQAVHGTSVEEEVAIRNAAFERLNPKTLDQNHERLVKHLYPE